MAARPLDTSGSAHASSRVAVRTRQQPYAVNGATIEQLERTIRLLGPRRGGIAYPAYTDWEIHWSHASEHGESGWSARDVSVVVNATITLPCWRPPRTAEPALLEAWRRLMAAIESHEQGHVDLAAQAAQALAERLEGLRSCPSRRALIAAARQLADQVLERARRRERVYDATTARSLSLLRLHRGTSAISGGTTM